MADVRTELERLQDRGILRVTSFPVPFEGRKAARTIADALARIGGGYAPPDVILVIRGGGAAAGLASLADLALARAICRCRVPIVTGIVHASDRTILDDGSRLDARGFVLAGAVGHGGSEGFQPRRARTGQPCVRPGATALKVLQWAARIKACREVISAASASARTPAEDRGGRTM